MSISTYILKKLNKIYLFGKKPNSEKNEDQAIALEALSVLGFGKSFSPKLFNAVSKLKKTDFEYISKDFKHHAKGRWTPLFAGFPQEYPINIWESLFKIMLDEHPIEQSELPCGCVKIPEAQNYRLNGCPVCGTLFTQTPELFSNFITHKKLVVADVATRKDIVKLAKQILTMSIRPSEEDIAFLLWFMKNTKIDNLETFKIKIKIKDITTTLISELDKKRADIVMSWGSRLTANDLLKVYNTHTEKHSKFSARIRKILTGGLTKLAEANLNSLLYDMHPKQKEWKIIFKRLHIAATKSMELKKAADILYHDMKSDHMSYSYHAKFVKAILSHDTDTLLHLISQKPTYMFRHVDFIIRSFGKENLYRQLHTLFSHDYVGKAIKQTTLKNLLQLKYMLEYRLENEVAIRMFKPNSKNSVTYQLKKTLPSYTSLFEVDKPIREFIKALDKEIAKRPFKILEPGEYVLSENLKKAMVPLTTFENNIDTISLARGTTYKLSDDTKFIRLFTYWKGKVDVDLSAMFVSEERPVQYCSFFNTSLREYTKPGEIIGRTAVHSGDVRSAPDGGAEYVDIDIEIAKKFYKYVVIFNNIYAGAVSWANLDAYTGVCEFKEQHNKPGIDPSAVTFRSNMISNNRGYLPLFIDLETMEITVINIYMNVAEVKSVYNYSNGLLDMIAAIKESALQMPNWYDLLSQHKNVTFGENGKVIDFNGDIDVYQLNEKFLNVK